MPRQVSDELIYRVSIRTDGTQKTIKELEDQLKALKAEVKSVAVGSADFEKALDNMAATQIAYSKASKELDIVLGKQTKSLGGINEAFDFQGSTLGQMKVALKDYRNQLLELPTDSAEFDSMSRKVRTLNDTIKDYERQLTGSAPIGQRVFEGVKQALEGADVATNKTVRSMGELNILMRGLQKEQAGFAVGSKEWENLGRSINNVGEELKAAKEQSKQFYDSLNAETKKASGQINQFVTSASQQLKTMGSLIVAGFSINAIQSFVGELDELTKAWQAATFKVAGLTGLQGEALNKLTADVKGLANTFETDYGEVAQAVNTLSKQFGLSAEESFALVEQGFLKGANAGGEYLKVINEYSTQFKAAGASAEELIALQIQAQQQGVFDDKALDSVKEFGLRIREQAQGTRDALSNAFGEQFSNDLLNAVNTGSISSIEALKRVSAELNNTELTASQTQTVLADVFGGAGEDAGLEFIKSIGNVKTSLAEVGTETSELQAIQARQLQAQKDLVAAQGQLADSLTGTSASFQVLKDQAITALIQGLTELILILRSVPQFIDDNKAAFAALGAALIAFNFAQIAQGIQALRAAFMAKVAAIKATTFAQTALNAAIRANPIGFVIGLIATLTAGMIVLYNEVTGVRATVDAAWASLKQVGTLIKDFVLAQFHSLVSVLESVGTVFSGLYKIITGDWKAGISQLTDGLKGAAQGIADLYGGNLIATVKEAGSVGDAAGKAYRKAFEDEAKPAAEAPKDAIDESIPELKQSATTAGTQTGKAFNDAARKEWESLQAELAKLRLLARIEIESEGGAIARINEEQRQAVEALQQQKGFALLAEREKNALLFAENQRFLQQKLQAAKDEIEAANRFDSQAAESSIDRRLKVEEQATAELILAARASGQLTAQYEAELTEQLRAQREQAAADRLELAEQVFAREQAIAAQQFEAQKRLIEAETISEAQRSTALETLATQRAEAERAAFATLTDAQLTYNDAARQLAAERIDIAEAERAAIDAKRQQAIEAERARLRERAGDETLRFRERLDAVKAYYDLELQLAQGNADAIRRIENEKAQAIASEYKALGEQIATAQAQIASTAIALSDAITGKRIEALNAEIAESDRRTQLLAAEQQAAEQQAQQATGRRAELFQQEADQLKARQEQELASKQKLEAAKAKEEKKAAAIRKAAAIAEAIINTARAILGAVAAFPMTAGQPFASINAALGVAQQAAILATKFRIGGVLEGGSLKGNTRSGGIFKGRSHAAGGIRFNAGGVPVEVEGDEIIMTRNVYRNPTLRAAASAINAAAGGTRFASGGPLHAPKFAAGGRINFPNFAAGGRINFPNFAAGGRMNFPIAQVPIIQDYGIQMNDQLTAEIRELQNSFKQARFTVAVTEFNEVSERVQAIESNGKY